MGENRKLKIIEEMNEKYKREQEKLEDEINEKDKQIIQLRMLSKQSEDLLE